MKCEICGASAESTRCLRHKLRKPLATRKKMSSFLVNKLDNVNEMRDFFLSIWKKRPHRSEVSGVHLGNEPLHVFFHHILLKEKCSEAMYDEENVILLTLDEHTNVHSNCFLFPGINERRIYLKKKYNIL